MAVYIVSYDLRAPGRDYSTLYARLGQWKAVRGLESVWFINWDTTPVKIRDDLRQYVDANDLLFVAELKGPSAWSGLYGNAAQMLVTWIDNGSR
ncbi:hypothetical protein GCM10011321_04650 [Youhaiella tibetensis]|uniref:CRISPR-associated protein Cas2 n=1 Tax=Paradevosia tibetensis TaxID=1447062 RepID=A0A5B9DSM2_9HYPH|nr:CRISPR-associated protein Cas2 [Youhaiella tibetensis]QEE21344.1 CRISPR-associated protein Cas2 [Youhaiella tibetensis]GGF15851.1 hypothetical protein GCM10011321_04650 [Youhaiella tibetensis]